MSSNPWYANREEVMRATDTKESAKASAQIDRALESASRDIEGLLHRRFYPWSGTRYFDWPSPRYRNPRRLWLDSNEVASVSQLVAGGVTIPSTDYFLRRADDLDEAPFTYIEIDRSSSSAFASGDTTQRAIAVTGVFIGCPVDEVSVGTLAASLAGSEGATATINWTTARFGVGDILRINNERMIITEKSMVDSTQNLGVALTASKADNIVAVSDGTKFAVEEIILIGSERMLVTDIAGNNLTVERAYDGTVLASHAQNADVYTLTGVALDRGELGTSIAAHSQNDVIYKFVVPGLIKDLCVAEAINRLAQENSKYARVVGAEGTEVGGIGRSLFDLRRDAVRAHGRTARLAAV